MAPYYDTLGHRILGELTAEIRGFQAWLARLIGIDQAAISRWASGDTQPDPVWRTAMKEAIGLPESVWRTPKDRARLDALRGRLGAENPATLARARSATLRRTKAARRAVAESRAAA